MNGAAYLSADCQMSRHGICTGELITSPVPCGCACHHRGAAYRPADEIRRGDVLPDVSRHPVATVTVFPAETVRVTFTGTEFVRFFPYGGPVFRWPAVRLERGAL